jgi:hypothetical protein
MFKAVLVQVKKDGVGETKQRDPIPLRIFQSGMTLFSRQKTV